MNSTSKPVNLADLYAKRMEYHGLGMGLFLPVSTNDLKPPCCGFFDRNGDWNLITTLSHEPAQQKPGYDPLAEELEGVNEISIKWQPKTSSGVQEASVDTSANTPNNVAGGADAHIKYSSSSKFGAILMTKQPVILKAYHQERLFTRWLESNKHRLYEEYGSQLRKYGLWVISKSYSTPAASINAWYSNNKDILVSIKAKASMLGELGTQLSEADTVMDKDWSHYSAKENVVVFVDGIETSSSYWWWKSVEFSLPLVTKSRSPVPAGRQALAEDIHHEKAIDSESEHNHGNGFLTTPERHQCRHLSLTHNRPSTLIDDYEGPEESVLKDAGILNITRPGSMRYVSSDRRPSRPQSTVSSLHSDIGRSRTPSLRRISQDLSGRQLHHSNH